MDYTVLDIITQFIEDFFIMKHFLFMDKDYKIEPRFRASGSKRMSLKSLTKTMGRGSSSFSRGNAIDTRQSVVTNVRFSRGASKASVSSRIDYLIKEEKAPDMKNPHVFGSCTPEEMKATASDLNFRIVISPENENVDCEKLTKLFMDKLETVTGFNMKWVSVVHYDKRVQHSHVFIDGVDLNGREIRFSPDVISHRMRDWCKDIATSMVGHQSEREIKEKRDKEIFKDRVVGLDRVFNKIISSGQIYKVSDILSSFSGNNLIRVSKRLEHLSTLGLVSKTGNDVVFQHGWYSNLNNQTRYNMFLDGRQNLKYSSIYDYDLFNKDSGKIGGVVSRVFEADKDIWNTAVVLEAADGNSFYVPLYYKTSLKEGDHIIIYPEKNQKGLLKPDVEISNKKKIYDFYKTKPFSGYGRVLENEYSKGIDR